MKEKTGQSDIRRRHYFESRDSKYERYKTKRISLKNFSDNCIFYQQSNEHSEFFTIIIIIIIFPILNARPFFLFVFLCDDFNKQNETHMFLSHVSSINVLPLAERRREEEQSIAKNRYLDEVVNFSMKLRGKRGEKIVKITIKASFSRQHFVD